MFTRHTVVLHAQANPALLACSPVLGPSFCAPYLDRRGHPLEVTALGQPWVHPGAPLGPRAAFLPIFASWGRHPRRPRSPAVARLAPSTPESAPWLISETPRNKEKAALWHSAAAGTQGLRAWTRIPAPWSDRDVPSHRPGSARGGAQAAAPRALALTLPLASKSMM